MRTISLIPNVVPEQKDLSMLSEAIMERNEDVFDSKLLLHESFNDAHQLRNIDAVVLAIAEYTERMKGIISKERIMINNIFKDLGETACNIDDLILSRDMLKECTEDELSKVKFSMYNYNVNTHLMKYIDIDDMITTYRKDSLDGISETELEDLQDNKDKFISYAMNLASEIDDVELDLSNYRDQLRKFLNGNSEKINYQLSKSNLDMLFDILQKNNELKEYLDTEYSRLCGFIDTIMTFANSVNHNELLMNAMNPNVSINKQNWRMSRYSTRTDSFEIVRDYLVTLFDVFNKCIDIYTITIAENAIAIKDMVTDACNILTIVINMKKNHGELKETFIDSICNSEYYTFESESIDTINECILSLSTFNVESILTESAEVLQEASQLKNKMVAELTRIKGRIIQLTDAFKKLAVTLNAKNKNWYTTIKSINANSIKNAVVETTPFYDNFNKISNIRVPEFNPNDDVYSTNSPDGFYKRYYSGLDTSNSLSNLFTQLMNDDKGTKKLNGTLAISVFNKCIKILDGYNALVDKISNENKKIANTVGKYSDVSLNESASLLEMSLFGDDYYYNLFDDDKYDVIMEAAGPVTPEDLDGANSMDDPKSKTGNKTSDSKTVIKYASWSYAVQAIRMRAVDKMYTSAVGVITKVAKSRSVADDLVKKNTATDSTNQEKNK